MRSLRIVSALLFLAFIAALWAPRSLIGTWQSDTGLLRWTLMVYPDGLLRATYLDRGTGQKRLFIGAWRVEQHRFCWQSPTVEHCAPYKITADELTIGGRVYQPAVSTAGKRDTQRGLDGRIIP